MSNTKPIFLIGIPTDESLSEQEFIDLNNSLEEKRNNAQERMPDYNVVVYTCDKIKQITFTILSVDGKQSNV